MVPLPRLEMSSSLTNPIPSSSRLMDTHQAHTGSVTYARRRADPPPAAAEPYGINWAALHAGSVIVDVGGGLGTSCLGLANAYPHLRFVVQDSSRGGENTQLTNAYCFASNGRVKFQAHDIYSPQPIRTATLFVLKHIVPGLSDSDARKVLSCLRLAAVRSTQLILIGDDGQGGRTPRHISQLLKSAGWGVTGAHSESGRTHPLKAIFASPV